MLSAAADPKLLNTIGLVLGIVGVVLIFVWGPPQPNLEEGLSLGFGDDQDFADGTTVAGHNAAVRSKRRRHKWMSRIGLLLVGLGFGAQLAAVWA